jgi:multicomponent Na+:H+ antiporter subunit E
MTALLQNIVLALLWAALTGEFTIANLILGFILGALLIWLGRSVTGRPSYFVKGEPLPKMLFRPIGFIKFVVIFLWEVVLANITIVRTVLSPKLDVTPAIVALPLDIKTEAEITLLANMITLTPGTLSLDVSDDRSVIYVHAVHGEDPEKVKQDIKQVFEKLVHEVFG